MQALPAIDRTRGALPPPLDVGASVMEDFSRLPVELPANLSTACWSQSLYLLRNLNSSWAMRLLDSFGKPLSGFLEGNVKWTGDFDECIHSYSGKGSPVAFSTRYCEASLPFNHSGQLLVVQVGACVPSGCSSSTDAAALINAVLPTLGLASSTPVSTDCHPLYSPFDAKAYAAIVLLCVFFSFVAIGTLFDVYVSARSSLGRDSAPAALVASPIACSRVHSVESCDDDECTHPRDRGHAGLVKQLLLCFSCYRNGLKLLSTAQTQDNLGCINGVRFFSICWVILGHVYVLNASRLSDGARFLSQTFSRPSFAVIYNATVSVDTFFLLSGLLAVRTFLKEAERMGGTLRVKDWALLVAHRYTRLMPAYAAVLMVWTCLAYHISDGPGWPTGGSFDACSQYWWTNLLFINNVVRPSPGGSCMDWTWYLANDMQFFLIAPWLALLLLRHRYVGIGAISLLVAGSVGSAAAVSVVNSFKLEFIGEMATSWFDDLYIKPWCRFQAYGIGLLLGYVLHQYSGKVSRMNWAFAVFGWSISATCCLTVLYAPYEAQFGSRALTATVAEAATYNSLSKVAWSVGVAWVVFACSIGRGGWVNNLLSWKPFSPLGRLTYCTYLIHPMVVMIESDASRDYVHLNGFSVVPRFLGMLVISVVLACAVSLTFEAPVLGMEKVFRERSKNV